MIHQRTKIRDAAFAAVRAALAPDITMKRAAPYDVGEDLMPCVFVTGGDGNAGVAGRSLDRVMMLEISIAARGKPGTIEDLLDGLQAEVEAALASDQTLSGTCQTSHITQDLRAFDKAGEVLGEALLKYRVHYGTTRRDPTTLT